MPGQDHDALVLKLSLNVHDDNWQPIQKVYDEAKAYLDGQSSQPQSAQVLVDALLHILLHSKQGMLSGC